MGLRLSVRESAWLHAVAGAVADRPGLIPVVKGNGYGFGRPTLMPLAAGLADQIAVGTVYEAADVPAGRSALVLTPHLGPLPDDLPPTAIMTVGSIEHVAALQARRWSGAVVLKLRSSMRRYGVEPDGLAPLHGAAADAGMEVAGYSIHLPLAGDDGLRRAEVEHWLGHLDPRLPLSVSHLGPDTYASLRSRHPDRAFRIRTGTAIWHADKAPFHLSADVLDTHPVRAGDAVGYRATVVPADGTVVAVGAGSAHGIAALSDGRSPFHYSRRRIALLEPPHMHTSMVFVPRGDPCPNVGDRVDVQRPLITTTVDELEWADD
jgi:alanine racemase